MGKTCVLYIAWRSVFVQKAVQSATSFKRYHPDIDVILIADKNRNWKKSVFDKVYDIEMKDERSHTKTFNLSTFVENTSYREMLYLDCDTYVCGDLSGLFALTSKFELALAHAPLRRVFDKDRNDGVPDAYPDFNSGVILSKTTNKMKKLFKDWHISTTEKEWVADQPSLCETIYHSKPPVRVCALPPEYNARVGFPAFFQGEVKILHANGVDLARISNRINTSTGMRLWKDK